MRIDRSSTALVVATNVAVIGIAWWQHWPLVVLLWPYWLQSVIIGWYSGRRILALRQFSLEGTSGFDQGSDEATKHNTARFFAMHYGVFHLGYFIFLFMAMSGKVPHVPAYNVTAGDLLLMAAIGVSFVFTHRSSYRRIMQSDETGRPNIGGVMFLPYLRILPMHLTIILGLGSGYTGGVILFGTLKTIADVLMHWVEYRITGASAAGLSSLPESKR